MRSAFAALLLPLIAGCGATVATPQDERVAAALKFIPSVTERAVTNHFVVRGLTTADVRRSLRTNALSYEGGRAVGLHFYRVSYRYRTTVQNGRCKPDVRWTIESTTTLPKWEDEAASPDSALRASWRDYVAQIARHEAGHRLKVAKAVEYMHNIMSMREATSCGALASDLSNVFNTRMRQLRLEQEAFDADPANRSVWRFPRPAPPPRG